VDEAARALGLTVDAVRKRVQRGTIEHERDQAGRVRIILDSPDNASTLQDESPDTTGQADALIAAKDETIEELRGRVRRLEREVDTRNEEIRRRDHLLAAALERIPPQLEAPQKPSEDAETVAEGPEGAEPTSYAVEVHESSQAATEAAEAGDEQQGRGEPHSATEGAQEGARRPWWRRMFGG
jgi:hypothetical protein